MSTQTVDNLIENIDKATQRPESKYNEDCEHYDYGKTCPTAYGAFCSLKKCCIEYANCKTCKDYALPTA
jgi:hypothetical protein